MLRLAGVALGSNLGDRAAHLAHALDALRSIERSTLLAHSRTIETAFVGSGVQPAYLNACAVLRTSLHPRDLLDRLLLVESARGRVRSTGQRWEPRTLDLDLLFLGSIATDEPGLTLPHPRLAERAFVLEPLAEVIPDFVVPGLDLSVRALRDAVLRPRPPRGHVRSTRRAVRIISS